jgi:hypothetical protein
MTILEVLTGRKSDEPQNVTDLVDLLVPTALPRHVSTLELSLSYRSSLSELQDVTKPGEQRVLIRRQLQELDNLIARQQLAGRMREAIAQRASDQAAVQKRLKSATKALASASATHREAVDKHAGVASRLADLKVTQERIERTVADEVAAAHARLDAAVLVGNAEHELVASREVVALQAQQGGQGGEAFLIALRVDRTAAHLAGLNAEMAEMAAKKADAEQEHAAAQIEAAKVAVDEAADRYLLALLQAMRAGGAAQRGGFAEIAAGLRTVEATALWVGDHRRTWLDGVDPRVSSGHANVGRVLTLIVKILDGAQLEVSLLREDLRQGQMAVLAN